MDTVEKIAEVVLYEGFLLYPYTRSTTKNQQRWTFGGVYPRAYSEASGGDDPWMMQTQCLVEGDPRTQLFIKVRFLQVVDRTVVRIVDGERFPVAELRNGEQVYRPWEEAMEREVHRGGTSEPVTIADLLVRDHTVPIDIPTGSEEESILDPAGNGLGAIIRQWQSLRGTVDLAVEPLDGQCYRLTVKIANTTPWDHTPGAASRSETVRRGFISTHTILRVRDGAFVSLLEPPPAYQEAARQCENIKTWPVLVGDAGERHTLLSSPIILYDYPQIAPESPVNFFDTTEIDELLALSVMTLTDDEKREMRETDPRAREILDRTESLTPEELMGLHGSIRSFQSLRRDIG
ncbi:MAG: hypothetical protein NVS2B16_33460 [Chloroflexota bacterium]